MSAESAKTGAVNRRAFLEWSMAGLLGGVFLALANIVARYLLPQPRAEKGGGLSLPLEQIPPGSGAAVNYKSTPVIVVNLSGGVAAFNAACTHLGCLVKWIPEKQQFLCPCHAGVFGADGKVLSGPPPEPLRKVDIQVVDERVVFL